MQAPYKRMVIINNIDPSTRSEKNMHASYIRMAIIYNIVSLRKTMKSATTLKTKSFIEEVGELQIEKIFGLFLLKLFAHSS